MDFYTLSDKYIEKELGHRIKALRLGKNITQKELAEATSLSLNSIKSLESGRGKLSTLIAVLRELEALDHLDNFNPAGKWTNQHQMSVNGKHDHFSKVELISTGKSISISRPEKIINDVITSVDKCLVFADKAGVKKNISLDIKKQHRTKL